MDEVFADRATAAHHEAGHAVVAVALEWTVEYVVVEEGRNEWTGDSQAHGPEGVDDPFEEAVIRFAGGFAEARHRGHPYAIPYGWCMEEFCDAWRAAGAEADARRGQALGLVEEHWRAVQALAFVLTTRTCRLSGEEATEIIRAELDARPPAPGTLGPQVTPTP